MSEHREQADAVERELDDMAHESEKLGQELEGVREDWDAKKRDARVPGAGGAALGDAAEQGDGDEDSPPPEADTTPRD